MGGVPNAPWPRLTGINADGSAVAGTCTDTDEWYYVRGFYWNAASGGRDIGVLPGMEFTEANAVSADGNTVVGTCQPYDRLTYRSFRWDATTGVMQSLGLPAQSRYVIANSVNADGSVIVGVMDRFVVAELDYLPRAFRWTQTQGFQDITPATGPLTQSEAYAVNADGSVIAGYAVGRAIRWTATSGMLTLGELPGRTYSLALAVSGDGRVIGGSAWNGGSVTYDRAFLWTQELGMVDAKEYIASLGVNVTGWDLRVITGLSFDGLEMTGYGSNNGTARGFVVRLDPVVPCAADLDNDGNFANGGVADQAATIDDLLYFLVGFEQGNPAIDLDNGTNTGTPDSAVTIDDLLYFLVRFESGC